jgi:hypothetical protein
MERRRQRHVVTVREDGSQVVTMRGEPTAAAALDATVLRLNVLGHSGNP